jgi:hypothetical protein
MCLTKEVTEHRVGLSVDVDNPTRFKLVLYVFLKRNLTIQKVDILASNSISTA